MYKDKLIASCLNSAPICELLVGKIDYSEDDVKHLLHIKEDGTDSRQIYPYLHMEEAKDTHPCYLCVEVDIPKMPSGRVKDVSIIIWTYCHRDKLHYEKEGYRGTKVDILADMIERQLHDSNEFGIGTLHLESLTHFYELDKFYGRQLVFHISDFKTKSV